MNKLKPTINIIIFIALITKYVHTQVCLILKSYQIIFDIFMYSINCTVHKVSILLDSVSVSFDKFRVLSYLFFCAGCCSFSFIQSHTCLNNVESVGEIIVRRIFINSRKFITVFVVYVNYRTICLSIF